MDKKAEVAEFIKNIQQLDYNQKIGILMMCEAANMVIQNKKKGRITRRSRLVLP